MTRSAPPVYRFLAAIALLAAAAGCSRQAEAPSSTPTRSASSTSAPAGSPTAAASATASGRAAGVTKLLVIVEENHSLTQMREEMPYTFSLAKRFGYAVNYYALTHPSLPNYLAIAAGQTFDVTDDDPPSAHRLPGQTVFGQALAQGRTATVYADAMPTNCATTPSGTYAVKHNPWAYFPAERSSCLAHDVPLGRLWGDLQHGGLPNAGMVVPDTCHDAHDCDLATADAWVRDLMAKVFAGPDWRSGHLAVVITADEDDRSQDNKVLTVVVHPSQEHRVVTERLDHYSLTRLYEDVVGAPHLANAGTAPSMSDAFGLPLG